MFLIENHWSEASQLLDEKVSSCSHKTWWNAW